MDVLGLGTESYFQGNVMIPLSSALCNSSSLFSYSALLLCPTTETRRYYHTGTSELIGECSETHSLPSGLTPFGLVRKACHYSQIIQLPPKKAHRWTTYASCLSLDTRASRTNSVKFPTVSCLFLRAFISINDLWSFDFLAFPHCQISKNIPWRQFPA